MVDVKKDRDKVCKNDKVIVRVICRSKCRSLALISKVRNKHMYIIKRQVCTHTWDRGLNNSFANSKWVVKNVAARMAFFDGVKIHDIVF